VFSDTERNEIAELKAKKKKRELEEIAATEELERLEDEAGMPKDFPTPEPVMRTADPIVLDLDPLTDLGWLQTDLTLFADPSFLDASHFWQSI
jgi:hypothetical protein